MAKTVALVLAGGRGSRVGGDIPKQYRNIAGIPMIRRTLARFSQHPQVDVVRAVIHPDDQALYRDAIGTMDLPTPIFGGETRQESGYNGLKKIEKLAPDFVLIQDAARPFTGFETIDRVLQALETSPAALAAMPVTDTLKRADGQNRVTGTVDRSGLWRAQTPQGFQFGQILAAHEACKGRELTDDAAIAEAGGLDVTMVEGDEENFKVTTEADLTRAERMARQQEGLPPGGDIRVGTGFDVHRFEAGDTVTLCGVHVPHTHGLRGHSDADVGLHALTDAILGTLAAGDIGDHFPPSDPQWRNVESSVFLNHAVDLVGARGGAILHLDVTLICESPKIGPHRDAMRDRVAELCGIDPSRVSVKATTTEQLGFTGRGEGIAAQATATVRL
ncbi:MAG: bifunctional 2-C-methyl-D-erythritol 4-phosphate cytidylyltransferase/2-C-methyl-D-erythritol 2,4-cyclodiphosphate synthase [Alphaproteobacteria bacterium]|nr:bifunctional 2-C-methyl-D-erythritol 4-phosphate cytidylyltransferase/2-C-methyl-D-erythritol 2,4-cyclodiphosphate synthase [Alphaproteobacteria bacterium]